MIRRRVWLAAALLAAVAATAAAPAGAAKTHARPMKGHCDTTFTVIGVETIALSGTCILTHLGKASYEATQTVSNNGDGTVNIMITGFYTAANGDILRSSLVGIGRFTASGEVSYSTTETYTGGTGRFADASGTALDNGVAHFTGPTTGTSSYVTAGSISY